MTTDFDQDQLERELVEATDGHARHEHGNLVFAVALLRNERNTMVVVPPGRTYSTRFFHARIFADWDNMRYSVVMLRGLDGGWHDVGEYWDLELAMQSACEHLSKAMEFGTKKAQGKNVASFFGNLEPMLEDEWEKHSSTALEGYPNPSQ